MNKKTVCSWCGKRMKGEETAEVITHGLCSKCERKEHEKLDQKSTLWEVGRQFEDDESTLIVKDGNVIASAAKRSDAVRIVRAVNSHDALMEIADQVAAIECIAPEGCLHCDAVRAIKLSEVKQS